MNIILKPITAPYEIDDIIESFRLNGVKCDYVPHNSYTLTHSLDQTQFDALVKAIATHHNLKPQHADWFPGTCTGDLSDYGYYVCPVVYDQYEEGDFDMCIMNDAIYYC